MKIINGHEVFTTIPEIVAPEHTALIIVDMQNDFIAPEGFNDKAGRQDVATFRPIIERSAQVIEKARQAGVSLVYILNTWLPDHKSVSGAWIRFMEKTGFAEGTEVTVDNTWGHQVVDELEPQSGDFVVKKWRSSAFIGTNLDLLLRSNGIKSVVMTGVATQGCVESTARDAGFMDYYVVVLSDCVFSGRVELHEASLKVMASRFDVVNSDEVLQAWSG